MTNMKRYLITISFFLSFGFLLAGQSSDPFVSKCVMNAGNDAKYLKDFRIQLGKATAQNDLRYKANMSLWKNTKYRFTMCSTEDSNKVVLSSYDKNSGKTYPFVDFVCNKSGIYQLNFDFTNGQQGSGVGIVSMVK